MRLRRAILEVLEDRRMLAAELHQANYFATWNASPRIIPSTDPADIGYNPRTGHLMIADSEIEEISQYAGVNMFEVSLKGDVLYDSYDSNNDEPTGVVWNDVLGHWVVCNDDSKLVTIYNDDFSVKILERNSTVQDDEGITVDNATGAMYIIDGHDGGMRVIKINTNLVVDPSFTFSVATGFLTDAEGIAFHQATQTLFVQGGKKLAQFSLAGVFLQGWDLSTGFSPAMNTPQGAVFAPTSNPSDSPSALALYISDGGNDNFPDGGIYELTITGLAGGGNSPPVVNAGVDQVVFAALPASTALAGSFSDDGLPVGGTVTRTWSQVSGPGAASFVNPSLLNTVVSFPTSGAYVLRLTVNDGALTTTDDVSISINIAKVQQRISASSDDAEQSSTGSVSLNSGDLELVVDGSSQTVGLRFPSLNIPKNAVITNAYVQFQADEIKTAATSLTIQGQAADNAATFVNQSSNVSSRPKTAASVAWNPAPWTVVGEEGVNQRTPEIKTIVQEIVNRPGWVAGNAMAMIVTGTGVRTARSFDGQASGAPMLVVEYSTAVTNAPPVVNAGADRSVSVQNLSTAITLNGTVTDDGRPLPANLTSQWSQISGPGTVTFANSAAATTSAFFSAAGAYVLRLTASDGALSTTDDVSITVSLAVDQPPVVNAGSDRAASGSLPLSVALQGAATDDGLPNPPATLVTTWTQVSGPGTVTFANAANPTTSATFPALGTYVLRLSASDSASTVADEVTITVTNAATVFERRILLRTDDAEEPTTGNVDLKSSDLEMSTDGSTVQTIGMRFQAMVIPKNATITKAYIQFTTKDVRTGLSSLTIRGEAADNAATYATTAGSISARPKTSASVAWSPVAWTIVNEAGVNQRSADVATLIQEIVNRPGWTSGNALALIVNGTGTRNAVAFDGVATSAPLLHVEYALPPAPLRGFASPTSTALASPAPSTNQPMGPVINTAGTSSAPQNVPADTKAVTLPAVQQTTIAPRQSLATMAAISRRLKSVDSLFESLGR